MTRYNIFAHHEISGSNRHFVIDSVDYEIAKALFLAENSGWEILNSRRAQCFATGDHQGELSVWQGQNGRTAILCRHHGENLPQ